MTIRFGELANILDNDLKIMVREKTSYSAYNYIGRVKDMTFSDFRNIYNMTVVKINDLSKETICNDYFNIPVTLASPYERGIATIEIVLN